MTVEAKLIQKDLQYLWHPCSQMKDYEQFKPLFVEQAQGSYIQLKDGKRIIDAFSSWWCKSLGHNHPRLKTVLLKQIEKFEHVILANTTNETIINLSEKLCNLLPSLNKISYASDGSSAVEMALKMSLHARQITGELKKNKFIALSNGYHGETTGALSVSDIGLYCKAYQPMLFETHFVKSIPYVTGIHDSLWSNCSELWQEIEKTLAPHAETATALIVEPLIQAAGGMKIYSQDFLKRLRKWTEQHRIHLIADEIMTGMGRTGKMLACEYADVEPDFLCLGKGLTSGWLPLSAMVTRDDIYQLFYQDYQTGNSFLHSHTYSGNALAASIALEVLAIINEENICARANELGKQMFDEMNKIADHTGKLINVRNLGGIVAADLKSTDSKRRLGYEVYKAAVERGALLRPLGNTLYWVPPLNTERETVRELSAITQTAILSVKF